MNDTQYSSQRTWREVSEEELEKFMKKYLRKEWRQMKKEKYKKQNRNMKKKEIWRSLRDIY